MEKIEGLMELVRESVGVSQAYNQERWKADTGNRTVRLLSEVQQLRDCGLLRAAEEIRIKASQEIKERKAIGYVRITDTAIKCFLEKKSIAYNAARPSKPHNTWDLGNLDLFEATRRAMRSFIDDPETLGWKQPKRTYPSFSERTNDYSDPDPSLVGLYQWTEVPVEEYKGLPPRRVINKLQEEKNRGIFDAFTIGVVKGLPDPLLMGRINGCSDRFYLAQWGDDITLDDLIEKAQIAEDDAPSWYLT